MGNRKLKISLLSFTRVSLDFDKIWLANGFYCVMNLIFMLMTAALKDLTLKAAHHRVLNLILRIDIHVLSCLVHTELRGFCLCKIEKTH